MSRPGGVDLSRLFPALPRRGMVQRIRASWPNPYVLKRQHNGASGLRHSRAAAAYEGAARHRRMQMQNVLYVGLDVHKVSISATVAEGGRDGEVNYLGAIPNTPLAVSKLAKDLAKRGRLEFCYEAGVFGYGLPSTDLAWARMRGRRNLDDPAEAGRPYQDTVDAIRRGSPASFCRSYSRLGSGRTARGREGSCSMPHRRCDHLMRARQQLFAFLFPCGRSYAAGKHRTQRHRSWLAAKPSINRHIRSCFRTIVKQFGPHRTDVINLQAGSQGRSHSGRWGLWSSATRLSRLRL